MTGQYSFDFDGLLHRPGLRTVAYGMGTDSTAMLIEMVRRNWRPDLITFADTGDEHPRTYAYLKVINAYLALHDFPTVTVVSYRPQRFKHRPYATLSGNCLANRTLPSLAFGRKACSLKFKADPQERYILKHWEPGIAAKERGESIIRLIGYDAGIKDHRRGAIKPNRHFHYAYPLQLWGMDRLACRQTIAAAGLPQPGKSACFFCPSSKPHEVRALAQDFPDLAARALAMEDRAKPQLTKIFGLWGRGTRSKPGSWRTFLIAQDLLPEVKPEHVEEIGSMLPTPDCLQVVPYLEIAHYQGSQSSRCNRHEALHAAIRIFGTFPVPRM